jgi:4-amino-4-deoxy-L-arabinose transferase-like glycosyltransferase
MRPVPSFRRRRSSPRPLLLLPLALALFLPLLGRRDIVTSHEGRVAQTAREMAAAGWPWAARPVDVAPVELRRDADGVMQVEPRYDRPPLRVNPWVVPVMSGELRLKKPPLPYWCTAVLFKLGGERESLARLVPALLGALATLLVADLARLLIGRRAGWAAGLVWLSSYFVFDEYRKAMADPYLAFFTLLCAWAWVRRAGSGTGKAASGTIEAESGRPDVTPPSRFILLSSVFNLLPFYTSLALGFLAKGPLILIPLGGFIAAYHVCHRRPAPRAPRAPSAHAAGLLVFALVALPWPIAVGRAVPDAGRLWALESTGGVTDTIENLRPWWFYVATLPQVALPWTPALLLAFALPFMRRAAAAARAFSAGPNDDPATTAAAAVGRRAPPQDVGARAPQRTRFRRRCFPLAWLIAVVLVFSLSGQKKNAYLLPVAPAVALAAAQVLAAAAARARLARMKGWPGALVSVQTALGVAFAVYLACVVIAGRKPGAAPFLLWLAPLAAAMIPLRLTARPDRWLPAVAAGYAATTFAFFNFAFTDQQNARSPRRFAESAAAVVGAPGANVFTPRLPPEAAFYLPPGLRYDPSAPEVFVVVDDRRKASEAGAPYFEQRLGRPVASVERVLDGVIDDPRWRLYRVRPAPMVAEAGRDTIQNTGGPVLTRPPLVRSVDETAPQPLHATHQAASARDARKVPVLRALGEQAAGAGERGQAHDAGKHSASRVVDPQVRAVQVDRVLLICADEIAAINLPRALQGCAVALD